MNKDTLIKYSPYLVFCVAILLQWRMFVTPEQMEIKHREILKDVSQTYTTKEQFNDVKLQLKDMQLKIDKIYEIITNK
ncbi:hypothetical protein IJI31_06495 [bacterium]|nr:hypothetical protein [bacterium]